MFGVTAISSPWSTALAFLVSISLSASPFSNSAICFFSSSILAAVSVFSSASEASRPALPWLTCRVSSATVASIAAKRFSSVAAIEAGSALIPLIEAFMAAPSAVASAMFADMSANIDRTMSALGSPTVPVLA